MGETAFKPGQLVEIERTVLIAASEALRLSLMGNKRLEQNPKAFVRALDCRTEVLAQYLAPYLEKALWEMLLLLPVKRVWIEMSKMYGPRRSSNTSVHYQPGFLKLVASKALFTPERAKFKVQSVELGRRGNITEIVRGIPPLHGCGGVSTVYALVTELTGHQSQGEAGDLLNTGGENLFYDRTDMTTVRWNADMCRWVADTFEGDPKAWAIDYPKETRVFYLV